MAKRRTKRRSGPRRGFASWSIGKKIITILGTALVLAVTVCVGIVASKLSKIETTKLNPQKLSISETAQEENPVDAQGYLNVALFGVDSRESELDMGTRSDTIMIASLNKATKEVRITSVFRDTLLEQKDGTLNKANAAYSFGGPEEAVALLNRNLDLDIQHYTTVNFNSLVDVIDLLGGITINITDEERFWMNGYAAETAEVVGQENEDLLEFGEQHLTGVQAVSFARIRYTSGDDFRRAERQREVLSKIAEKAQKAKLSTINKIIDKVFPEISTNFTMPEILNYAKDALKYKLGETTGFPADNATDSLSGVGSTVIPVTLESNVIKMHQFLFGEDGYMPSYKVTKISSEIAYKANGPKSNGDTDSGGWENNSYENNSGSNYSNDGESSGTGGETTGGTNTSGGTSGTDTTDGTSGGNGSGNGNDSNSSDDGNSPPQENTDTGE